MIQKERTRSLQLIDEVAEIFQISSLFLEQLDKVTRELQNLISCYKNIYCSKSQTHVQSCHQFLLKKKSSPSLATAKPSAEKQVAEKYNFIHFFLSLPSTDVPSWQSWWSCSHTGTLHVILCHLWCARPQQLFHLET